MIKLKKFTDNDIPKLISQLESKDIRFLYQFGGINYKFPLDFYQIKQTMDDKFNLLFNVIKTVE
ncbi:MULTISPECIES: hypothetical protein [unclassified Francisella]|uniref:hypothetical protein n=1 Tax=unclassified Francisella TaxID=2610885 RepID=UPI002E339E60|nr:MULTISPECIES: hypothetical protein [unclassified Francisella]MED7818773.1 hypothetical protein [Francisella sp. 19S2-4]MED7829609.1 hypothetical protein [Francisella sp. 19S2-10]